MDKLEVVGWTAKKNLAWLRGAAFREATMFSWEPAGQYIALTPHAPAQAEIDRLRGEVARLQRLIDDATADNNTAEAQVFTLRGTISKAVRILSDSKAHELTRILDARDVLILSDPTTLKDTPHD